jgi:hypothetical protein
MQAALPLYRSKYKAAIKEANLQQDVLNLYKKDYENNLLSQYTLAKYKYDYIQVKLSK